MLWKYIFNNHVLDKYVPKKIVDVWTGLAFPGLGAVFQGSGGLLGFGAACTRLFVKRQMHLGYKYTPNQTYMYY